MKEKAKLSLGKDKEKIPVMKSSKLIPKLPYVFKNEFKKNKNDVNTTNKKISNNYINKYNIVPLVLPFIKGKPGEKRNIII